jgi:hypothetical protein
MPTDNAARQLAQDRFVWKSLRPVVASASFKEEIGGTQGGGVCDFRKGYLLEAIVSVLGAVAS